MHQFKYKGVKKIGNLLANTAGGQLAERPGFKKIDAIIPVPLHKSRLGKREYNQSVCFTEGLSERLNIPVAENNLVFEMATETQTHRPWFLRFENMQQVFIVNDPDALKYSHVLLVDVVVTTSSTLEACGAELLKIEGLKLSIATTAYAE